MFSQKGWVLVKREHVETWQMVKDPEKLTLGDMGVHFFKVDVRLVSLSSP